MINQQTAMQVISAYFLDYLALPELNLILSKQNHATVISKLQACPHCNQSKNVSTATQSKNNEWLGQPTKKSLKKILIYQNGLIYRGEIVDGKRHGHGTLSYHTGETYIGEFVNDKRQGKGVLVYADGSRYIGDFNDDCITGKSEIFNLDGMRDKDASKNKKEDLTPSRLVNDYVTKKMHIPSNRAFNRAKL